MSYSKINKLYDIFKNNQNETQLNEENNKLANWLIDGYLSIKSDFSQLTDVEVFQLSIAAFYQDKVNDLLINEFLQRFHQGFNSVEHLIEGNKFITFYFIERAFSVSQQTEKNKSLAHHFFKHQSAEDIIDFFPKEYTNLLRLRKYWPENESILVKMSRQSSLDFWISILDYYGFDLKDDRGLNIWGRAAAIQRVDLLNYLDQKKVSYTRVENGEHTPLTQLMKRRHIYDEKSCQIYDCLIKQDKSYIQNYQKDHQKLLEYFIKYVNMDGIDYLVNNNFDFSNPSFTHYIEKCDNYEVLNSDSEEESQQKKDYMNQLKQKIIYMEKEILEASIIDSQQSESITSSKRKIKL